MELNIYGIFKNGYLVDKGTREYICDKYRVGRKSFYEYMKPWRRLKGMYTVSRINGDEEIEMVEDKPIDNEEEQFDYLFSMLRIYGNTTAYSFDPRPFKKKLMENGIFCEMRNRGDHYYIEVMA